MAHDQIRFARLKMNKIYKQVEKFKNEILCYKLKACLKRYVFTWHLKFDRESRLDISLGRLFQGFGPHNRMLYHQVLGVSCRLEPQA